MSTEPAGGAAMPIVFKVTPRAERWVSGSRVVADLTIENATDAPIEILHPMFRTSTQPVYRITPPDGDVVTFAPSRAPGADDETRMLVIAPGETWNGDLAISDRMSLNATGTYTIAASLEWNGGSIDADSSSFEIVDARFEGLSPSTSQSAMAGESECVFMQLGESGLDWFAVLVRESDPKNAEMEPMNPQLRGKLPEGTLHVIGARANYSTALDPVRWIVSHNESLITVGSNSGDGNTLITNAEPLRRVLTPLAVEDGLFVLALVDRGDGAVVGIARVPRPDVDAHAAVPMTDLWPLDAKPVAVAAALAPENLENAIAVAAISDAGDRINLRVAHLSPDGEVLAFRSGTFKGVLADDAIAIHWGSDGLTRVSFLCHSATSRTPRYRIVEVVFDDKLLVAQPPEVPPTLEIGGAMVDATVEYFETTPGDVTRGAVVRTDTAAWSISPAGIATAVAVPLTERVALLRGVSRWYAFWTTGRSIANAAL
jgi:hypothetical protein